MSFRSFRVSLVLGLLITLSIPALTAGKLRTTGPVSAVRQLPDGFEFRSGDALVRATIVHPGIFRLRYTTQPDLPPDHSFAVLPQAQARDTRILPTQTPTELKLTDGDVLMTVNKSSGQIVFADKSGTPILADQPNHPAIWTGKGFRIYKSMAPLDQFFGLGDKSDGMNHR